MANRLPKVQCVSVSVGYPHQSLNQSINQSVWPDRYLAENPQRKAQRQRKTDHQYKSDIRIHDVIPRLVDSRVIPRPFHHARSNLDPRLWNVAASNGAPAMRGSRSPSIGLADRTVTAWHDIHMAVRALPMPMHPDNLFRLAASRAARHQMRRFPGLRGLSRRALSLCRITHLGLIHLGLIQLGTHLGPSLSFSRCRAAALPSWNVPSQASRGKSTLP